MRQVIRYESRDGCLFHGDSACVEHERRLDNTDAANVMLRDGSDLDSAYFVSRGCDSSLPESIRAVLRTVTMRTKIAIPHWQCRDEAGYSVRKIEPDGTVFVFGDVGSWSGPWGRQVSIAELVDYVTTTRERLGMTAEDVANEMLGVNIQESQR
jgi:hypothetical protein